MEPVQLREVPNQPDPLDSQRVRLVVERWEAQDDAYETIERTIEEHVRMLSGRQWDVWSDLVQGFVDPTRYMSDEERRWRQRPVMDFLGYWYMVTLSKVTENSPIVGFLPNNADEHSAMLAEIMDPVFKTLWDEAEMSDRLMQVASWCLAGGEAYLVTRPDYTKGEMRPRIGPAVVPYRQEGVEDAIDVLIDDAPYGEDGEPLVEVMPDEAGGFTFEATGDPYLDAKGMVRVDVASPLEIRAQWGNHIPWNEKAWMIHRWFLLPDEVEATYGQKVEANVRPTSSDASPGVLERMLFGAGYSGAARGDTAAQNTSADNELVKEYVCGYTMWEKPCPDYPDGRLLVVAGDTVLYDAPRPFKKLECAGPIRRVQFMPLPGRPIGSTPLEKMVPLQKRYNRIEAQIAEHTNLCTNPILLVHENAGIDAEGFTARPGQVITHNSPSGVKGGEWLSPPALGIDVWKHKGDVRDHLFTIGSITGNEGENPAADASGELIQQLRFNADRPLSPLTRSIEFAAAGVAEDWLAILPTMWDEETIIHYAGEDNVVKAATILPEMWEGSVSARPVMESAAPESREKRQERVFALYTMGAFGNLQDPMQQQQAIKKLLDLSRFPELTRAAKPGGKHRMMAEHNLGKLLRGVDPSTIPILPMYDMTVHLAVFDDYMSGPDYLQVDEMTQTAVMAFREQMTMALEAQQAQQLMQQADLQQAGQATGLLPASTGAPPSESGRSETKGIPNENRFDPNPLP